MKNPAAIAEDVKGVVFDIQRYSLHDGPGLRTNVFLKGCGLSCWWCSNPEGGKTGPEIGFFREDCFLCGDCIHICPSAAIRMGDEKILWDASKCDICGQCLPVCPSRAFRLLGKEMTATQVMEDVLRDSMFFQPHGGLTLTGGEPSLQPYFAYEILRQAKAAGIHTAIETCGAAPQINFGLLLPYLDLILFDLKHLDPEMHLRMTGQDNKLVLQNLNFLLNKDTCLIIRIPIIPGFNADKSCLNEMARFICSFDKELDVHLLSYHTLGKNKYAALGKPYPMGDVEVLKPGEMEVYAEIFRKAGIHVTLGG